MYVNLHVDGMKEMYLSVSLPRYQKGLQVWDADAVD